MSSSKSPLIQVTGRMFTAMANLAVERPRRDGLWHSLHKYQPRDASLSALTRSDGCPFGLVSFILGRLVLRGHSQFYPRPVTSGAVRPRTQSTE